MFAWARKGCTFDPLRPQNTQMSHADDPFAPKPEPEEQPAPQEAEASPESEPVQVDWSLRKAMVVELFGEFLTQPVEVKRLTPVDQGGDPREDRPVHPREVAREVSREATASRSSSSSRSTTSC